jgi:dolichol kinase
VNEFIQEIPFASMIIGGVLLGLYLANTFYDLAPNKQWITRKVGHLSGYVGYILCAYMFSSWIWPFILSVGFLALLVGMRMAKGSVPFRGIARTTTWAEIWYPFSSAICIAVLWGIYDERFLAVFCISLLGISDAITGIVRSRYCTTAQKHWSGSVAFFVSALLSAWVFVHPFWFGVLIAAVGTFTEWASGDVSKIKFMRSIDDNLSVPIVAMMIVVLGLLVF